MTLLYKVNNKSLERVSEHKTLGVHIDESLTWRPHINIVRKKISAGLAVLRRITATIPFDTRIDIYIVYVIESAAYGVIFTSCLCQSPNERGTSE